MPGSQPLKIAFILPENFLAGGVFVTYLQAAALKRRGHDVTVLFVRYNASVGFKHFSEFDLNFSALDSLPPDIHFDIAIATWWETFYELPKVRATKHLYFVQSDERRFYPISDQTSRGWVELTYSFPQIGVVTEARWIQKLLADDFHLKVAYAPNGVDTNRFSSSVLPLSPKGNKVRVLIEGPGGIDFKRVDDAFRMTEGVDGIEVWYVCSDGVTKPNWKYDRIFKTVPFKEMPSVYRSCDLLIKVSAVEGFFGPPLEMMACGGTCIVSNVTGHDEYVVDKENALVINIGDIEAGKRALALLVTDKNLRLKLSENGILTGKKFDWAIQHPKFEAALLDLFHDKALDSKPVLSQIKLLSEIRSATEKTRLLAREMERPRYKMAKWVFDIISACVPSFFFSFGSVVVKRLVPKQKP